MSTQRTVVIVFAIKVLVAFLVLGVMSGTSVNTQNNVITQQSDKVTSNNMRLQDYFLQEQSDTDGTYLQDEIGDVQLGFEAGIWDYLRTGLIGWSKVSWGRDNAERSILMAINVISMLINLLLGLEIFFLVRGKTT